MPFNRRILLVRSDVRLAGPGMAMHAMAHSLRNRGWHVEIASGGGQLVSRFEDDGFRHHLVSGLALDDRSAGRMLNGMWQLRKIVRGAGIGIAHSFNAHAGLLAWLATRGCDVGVVNTVLGAGKEQALRTMPFRLIAVSNFVKRKLQDFGVRESRIDVVYNSTLPEDRVLSNLSEFEKLWAIRDQDSQFRLVGIAMMNGDKGHHDSIEAFARLTERHKVNVELIFVGDGTRREVLERFAHERGVGDRIIFAGAQSDVYAYLDRAHAFLHLSPQETFGMVLAEAHARGLPVISYSVGGIPEVVSDGESGVLVPCGDIDAVVSAIHDLASDRLKARELGWAGVKRATAMFTQPRFGERLESIYTAL